MPPPAPTPARPAPRRAAQGWRVLLGAMLFGALVAYLGIRLAAPLLGGPSSTRALLRAQLGRWAPLALALAMLGIVWVVLLVHELGHAAGARLGRWRVRSLVVGPLRLARDGRDGRLRPGLNRSLALYGGVVSALPTDAADPMRGLTLLVAGGPAASVLLALAAWLAAPLAPSPLARVALVAIAVASAGIACVTLVPARTGGFATDGARLLRLLRRGPEARREAATIPLAALLVGGTRPREWPRALLDAATALDDGTMEECTARLLAYLHHLDAGRVDAAGAALDRALALRHTYPAPFAPALDVEGAYFAAAHRGDAAGARAVLAGLPERSPAVKPHDRALVEAAVLRAQGDASGAARVAAAALPQVPDSASFTRVRLVALAAFDAPSLGRGAASA